MGVRCAWAENSHHGTGRQSPMIELRRSVQLKRTLLMLNPPVRDLDEAGIEGDGCGEPVPSPTVIPELAHVHAPLQGGGLVAAAELPGKLRPRLQFQRDAGGGGNQRLEEGPPFFEVVGGDGERKRFCRGGGRNSLRQVSRAR